MLTGMMHDIVMTRPNEIGCLECFDQLDRYVDAHLLGLNAAREMPQVKAHLDLCPDCREESDALLSALRRL